MILPPANNLADKGRPTGGDRVAPAPAKPAGQPGPSMGAGGPGVRVFGDCGGTASIRHPHRQRSGLIGPRASWPPASAGEGVWLLPSGPLEGVCPASATVDASPGHMLDWVRACKGGDPSCSDFSITGPYAEWLALAAIAFRVPGKLDWDTKNLRFTNSAEANKYVKPIFRRGWEMKL